MPFILPTFMVDVNIWNNALVSGAPTIQTKGNLSPGRRVNVVSTPLLTNAQINAAVGVGYYMELLLPKLTDVRGLQNNGVESVVECPAGSARFYLVVWVDDVGKGFANEHRMALLAQCNFTMVTATVLTATFGAIPPWPSPLP